ncbi:hypothetical protein WBG78_20245 [Chryseolinea sp. T2]|uniref:hypothetical protein n=1 Tax=Chryseolinea sp. T2 TaxID=3129255 RepID=UPI003076933A
MDDIFPLGKKRFTIVLSVLMTINAGYWIVYVYLQGPHPSIIDIITGIIGFCFIGPLLSAIPAAFIALIPIAAKSYWKRWLRHTLGLWAGFNVIFIVVMIMELAG